MIQNRRVSPFISYFGAKAKYSHLYPPPRYRTIIEPFAGAAGYSTRYMAHDVILVEKNPRLAAMWTWLIKAPPEEVLSLPLEITDLRKSPLSFGARTFIGFWLGAGRAHPCVTPSKWVRTGAAGSSLWGAAVRARIAKQVPFIKHWRIVEGDYSLASEIWKGEATWFVDPPYQVAGKIYPCGATKIDYAKLGAWCQNLKGQVIACENSGADWLPFRPFATFARNGPNSRHKESGSQEVIWLSDGNYRKKPRGLFQ